MKDLLLARAAANYCDVVLYCFMPDHLHVILHGTADEADVWRAITDFKQRSGYWLQQHKELYAGATWQKDFYDHTIRTREDLGAQVRYSANNPVRKDLVKNWDEYQFTGPSGADLRTLIDSAMTL